MDLALLWWNVGLRPGAGKAAPDAKRTPVLGAIVDVCRDLGYDVIGLCEVSEADVAYLESCVMDYGFSLVSFQDVFGKLRFDMCLLYRSSKLSVVTQTRKAIIDSSIRRKKLKIGGSVMFESIPHGELISIVCSHWPARMNDRHWRSPIRGTLGRALKQTFRENVEVTPYVILMGDYNDEPHDDTLFLELEAGRDCGWALLNNCLYNPFWRHLGGDFSPISLSQSTRHGSYSYPNSMPQQDWWMFDQIIFSPAFLGLQGWILDEARTGVLDICDLQSPDSENSLTGIKMDHLPVCSRVIRNVTND
ncbi:endonuclease/exonuclease/phosphatase family protein [Stenotrophomonas maltophilia]|uniref:endonuclease/exonuclease/phosphatase family protein n=1 Tax=Stenotrophomonas maltophilia TaxID=40324 RepID=UPI0028942A53|nr:endonuclease/exonuclease/phosphatase family protein [Stenotrophomonas maltophilia]MDT3487536.1 endonuclease/exonuclease/phosphatase family protein [Stenotrophomonas maltophilia]